MVPLSCTRVQDFVSLSTTVNALFFKYESITRQEIFVAFSQPCESICDQLSKVIPLLCVTAYLILYCIQLSALVNYTSQSMVL